MDKQDKDRLYHMVRMGKHHQDHIVDQLNLGYTGNNLDHNQPRLVMHLDHRHQAELEQKKLMDQGMEAMMVDQMVRLMDLSLVSSKEDDWVHSTA